jgi:hypothetical protein
MRLEKLRQVDLNLLIIFGVIAEEKSVTKGPSTIVEPTGDQPRPSARALHIPGRTGDSLVSRV